MQKKLTITVDEQVYLGLHSVVGRRNISQFINSLVRPHVLKPADIHCSMCDKQLSKTDEENDTHIPPPEELLKAGAVPVPNYGWFCSQACATAYEKKVGKQMFQRDAEGHVSYY